jgi:hypothetical protein
MERKNCLKAVEKIAMKTLPNFWRKLKFAAAAAGSWLAFEAAAVAQAPKPEEAAPSGAPSFAICYGLVFLGIALGLAFVLRGSNRRERAKPETYGNAK